MIKKILCILVLVFCLDGCAMGRKPRDILSRRVDRKLWYWCTSKQFKNSEHIGKVCSSECLSKRKVDGSCKNGNLKLIYKDITTEEGHEFFSKSNHIIINERDLR